MTPPPTPSPGPGRGAPRGARASKLAQYGSKRRSKSQDGLQDGPRYFKMGQDSLRHTPKRPQDCPRRIQVSFEPLTAPSKMPKSFQKPKGNPCFWQSRLFTSDGPLGPQDGPKMAQESPKRGPRRPKVAPRSPKRRPRALQDGPKTPFESLRGGGL